MKLVLNGIWAVSVIVGILILGVLASAPGVAAVPITFEFTGEVTSVDTFGLPSGIGTFVSVGDPISGTYTFDSLAPDAAGGSTVGRYAVDDFSVTVRFLDVTSEVGLVTFGAGPSSSGSIEIANNIVIGSARDSYGVTLQFPNPSFRMSLTDFDASVFGSDVLVLDPPDFSAFESASFIMFFISMGFDETIVQGSITSLTLATPDVTQAQLDAALAALAIAEAQRDAALDDLINLFTNNSCDPLAGTIPEVFDCITALIADLADALLTITDLEALVEELGQPGPPVANQGEGKGVPAQGKNNP